MSILDEIFAHKRLELAERMQAIPESDLEGRAAGAPGVPDFQEALREETSPAPRLIAEVKKRSPSKGLLSKDFDPLRLASLYAQNGAAAVSVLTDEKYFGGSLEYLEMIAEQFRPGGPPLLRKDFIFDRYQLLEARAAGASAALLITAMLDQHTLENLILGTKTLQLTPLVEVHNKEELQRALDAGAQVIGVNNRDLHTFTVDLQTSLDLAKQAPAGITLISESGIRTHRDLKELADAGFHAVLVGESIVTAPDPAAKVRQLAGLEAV